MNKSGPRKGMRPEETSQAMVAKENGSLPGSSPASANNRRIVLGIAAQSCSATLLSKILGLKAEADGGEPPAAGDYDPLLICLADKPWTGDELGSALSTAAKGGREDNVGVLLSMEPEISKDWIFAALSEAVRAGDHECAQILIPRCDVSSDNGYLLKLAGTFGSMECAQLLLAAHEHTEDQVNMARANALRDGREELARHLDQLLDSMRDKRAIDRAVAMSERGFGGKPPRL